MNTLRRLVDYATIEPLDCGLVQPLLVAAGGGGDAIAASLFAAQEGLSRPVIATWAWERLIVDPLPGPRGIADFEGLDQPADDVHVIRSKTRPMAPAGSTLPQLAEALDADLVLLDPDLGCRGLAAQIRAAANWCGASHITVVDVGGDAVARPGDPGLRSPMADITSIVATTVTGLSADLVVIGPGADGELAPDLVCRRLGELGAQELGHLDPKHAQTVLRVLQWHPSEATALVVMAALGYRGRVEIRDSGLPVDLADGTSVLWRLDLESAEPASAVAARIGGTTTLASLEMAFQDLYRINEIDYDRQKAAILDSSKPPGSPDVAAEFLHAARERGSEWVTRRRLREATGTLPDAFARDLLIPTA
jgi:hypothetical protein